jgi:hypothetical protein
MARDTGVFWRDLHDSFRMSLDRISLRDGVGQTLMLIENVNSRNWGAGSGGNTVYPSPGTSKTFTSVLDCGVGIFATPSSTGSSDLVFPALGTLNENMSFAVYASLLTPGGARNGQTVIGDNY